MTRKSPWPAALVALLLCLTASAAFSQTDEPQRRSIPPRDSGNPLSRLISGYEFLPLSLRALQDDDFDNPGFEWVARGETAWSKKEGAAGASCATCHGSANQALRGRAAEYPKFHQATGKVISLAGRINLCRETRLEAEPLAHDSEEMLGLTAFLRLQSRGVPMDVAIEGPAKDAFERGQKRYNEPLGQLGMSCAQCHNKQYGKSYGGKIVNQGHANGFPAYRMSNQTMMPLHEQFNRCFARMKAEPFALGSPDYVDLELYLAWRGAGLPLTAPGVRP